MHEIIEEIEKEQLKAEVPQFEVGDTVRVANRIKEGEKSRIQMFEGVVMKIQNVGSRKTFTVRKMSAGVGVEKTWPLHSPAVEKVEVIRRGKVRRAKLGYLRGRVGKDAKVKELELEVKSGNTPAICLYESLGFERTGLRTAYYQDGSDAVLMTKKL